jgi:hypothetical protein
MSDSRGSWAIAMMSLTRLNFKGLTSRTSCLRVRCSRNFPFGEFRLAARHAQIDRLQWTHLVSCGLDDSRVRMLRSRRPQVQVAAAQYNEHMYASVVTRMNSYTVQQRMQTTADDQSSMRTFEKANFHGAAISADGRSFIFGKLLRRLVACDSA